MAAYSNNRDIVSYKQYLDEARTDLQQCRAMHLTWIQAQSLNQSPRQTKLDILKSTASSGVSRYRTLPSALSNCFKTQHK